MSVLERRLQLLLDAERFARVDGEAKRSGRSVASVIREAIDFRFPDDGDRRRMAAAEALLSSSETPESGAAEGPAELKELYEQSLVRKYEAT